MYSCIQVYKKSLNLRGNKMMYLNKYFQNFYGKEKCDCLFIVQRPKSNSVTEKFGKLLYLNNIICNI